MTSARGSRQSFLGTQAQDLFAQLRVAVLGLGGGGSHIVQQLAHIGFRRFVVCDPDVVEDTNLNRLIGATERDVARRTRKIDVARRLIRGLAKGASIQAFPSPWQECAEAVRSADIIFGCLDGYAARQALEAFSRRYLLPLIDIGMDVHCVADEPPAMSGQVILSLPGEPCMMCLGFLNELTLTQEATRYGDAGVQPQVVWANGVLASTAVGIAVELVTGWTAHPRAPIYLEYDGNLGVMVPHKRVKFIPETCAHYPVDATDTVGDPVFQLL
jgi:hypothetical protein